MQHDVTEGHAADCADKVATRHKPALVHWNKAQKKIILHVRQLYILFSLLTTLSLSLCFHIFAFCFLLVVPRVVQRCLMQSCVLISFLCARGPHTCHPFHQKVDK